RLVTERSIARGFQAYLRVVLDVRRVRNESDRLALEQDLECVSVVLFPLCMFLRALEVFELVDGLSVAAISRVGGGRIGTARANARG
ncbi:9042_t:CDS:2, partial [Scutellospora calospora]